MIEVETREGAIESYPEVEDNQAKAVEDVSAIETLAVEEGEGNSVKSEQLRVDPQQEPAAVVDTSFSGGLFQSLPDLDFAALFEDEVIVDTAMSKIGSSEMSMLLSPLLERGREELSEEFQSGGTASISEAVSLISNSNQELEISRISKEVDLAQNSYDLGTILQDAANAPRKPVSMLDLRQNFIVESLNIPSDRMRSLSINIEKDAVRSTELAKMKERVWENTNLLGVVFDAGEYVLPTTVATEEWVKFNNGLSEALDKIKSAPVERQEEVFNKLVDTWLETETLLISNNNSLLVIDQLDGLQSAIREGGLGFIQGNETTDAQYSDILETAINATVFGAEFKGYVRGIKGLMKFLAYRIFPSDKDTVLTPERLSYVPFTEARNSLVVKQPTSVKISENVRDIRKDLSEAADKKGTREFRINLEKEKKELGKLKDEVSKTNTNTEARALAKEKKIKFKDALKIVNQEKQKQLDAIARRQGAVQEMVNEFDAAATAESKLSRLDAFKKDGRAADEDLFEPTGERKVEFVYDTRTETSAYDQIVKEKLSSFHNGVKSKGLKNFAEDVGLSPQAMAARLLPTPSDTTDLGYPNLNNVVNELILVDEDALVAGARRAKALARSTGSSLKLQDSSVTLIDNADEASLGNFRYLLGDGDEGFESFSLAEEAMNNALIGVDWKVVVKRNGKWYIEVQQKHEFNPRYDTKNLYVDVNNITNISSNILDPLRRLGEDVLKGVFALKGYNRSQAQKMQSELESIFSKDNSILAKAGLKPMSSEDVNSLTHALKYTDNDGQDWIKSVDEFAVIVGRTAEESQNTYKRYLRIQKLMDDIYQIRNEKYRKSLVARDIKDVTIGDEVYRGSVVLKPEVKKVYDIKTKKDVLVESLDPSQTVIKLDKAIIDKSGEYRRLVISNKKDIKELPAIVLNQRAGHIDRFYKETGWTVKTPVSRIVDGVEEKSFTTTHIVKTEEQAKKATADLLEKEGVEATYTRARENKDLDGIYGDESSVQYGYAGVHTKQRGEILRGSDGQEAAETLGVLESLSRTIGSVERQLDVDIINSLRSRFLKQFENYFKNKSGTSYSGKFEDMIDTSGIPTDVAQKAKQWHNYIEGISKVQEGEGYKIINNFMKNNVKMGVDSQSISGAIQNFATQMVIVGRPIFQIIQNTAQLIYVAEKYPVEMVHTVKNLIPTLLSLKNTTPENIKNLAKAMGIDEKLARNFIEEIKNNGLWDAVGMSDDFMRLVQKNSLDAASTKKGNAFNVSKNLVMSAFTASKAGQEGVIKLVNLAAYMSEFQKSVIKNGKKFDASTKTDMSFNAQKITQTQNSVNQFDYQSKSSLLSPMFQFTQHVHKLYLDLIVDPVLKLTKDPVLKALGKEVPERVSPLASSYLQATGSLIATYAIFGPQGIFGGLLGSKVEDAINQIENPIAREALQGNIMNQVINSSVNAMGFEGQVDFSSKMHPASVVDTFYDYHVKEFALNGTLAATGAAGYVVGVLGKTANAVYAISGAEGFEFDEKASHIIDEVLSNVAGISDYQRAYMSYHLGNYVYKSSLSGNLPVTKYESLAQLGNFTPTAIQDRWQEFSSNSAANNDAVKTLSQVLSRAMHRDLAKENSYLGVLKIANKYSGIATNSVDVLKRGEIVESLSRYVSPDTGKDFKGYFEPYLDQRTLEEQIPELQSLKEDASTDEMRRQIDNQITVIKAIIPEIDKAFGK
tara:strand:- start:1151 stop:6265 length:5115 start_codon:yes stop_codon:yes gene_type:complete